jgi:cell surface protein SprA
MNLKNLLGLTVLVVLIAALVASAHEGSFALENPFSAEYILAATHPDTIPLRDRYGDFMNDPSRNPFNLKDPGIIKKEVEYDPASGNYIIYEKIGDDYFRSPTYMTFSEYLDWKAKQQQEEYFDRLGGVSGADRSSSGIVDPLAKFDLKNNLVDRLFGGTKVDIRPQGNIDLTFGWRYSKQENPGFTIRQQRVSAFDFDMDINMSVEGRIGDKLRLNFNYNSQPTFDFDNQMKLHYDPTQFSEDDIIQNIEAGNVSLPLRGSLIQGAQSLFGIRLDTKWGPLKLSTIVSQQKSDQKNLQVQGGAEFRDYEVFADQYDENRHFFLSHYNRETFEEALEELPIIRNVFQIEKIQVFLTNDRNVDPTKTATIIAMADLGEPTRIVNPDVKPAAVIDLDYKNRPLPYNRANDLYGSLLGDTLVRQTENAVFRLQVAPYNLQLGRDFEKTRAQILIEGQEYTVNKELGYVSLNINVQPDQVVGVSYQYSYNGKVYQVGEFANDVSPTSERTPGQQVPGDTVGVSQTVVFTKMLKSATQRIDLPMWDLMMKNIYNIGAYNVNREDFQLDVYYEEPGGGEKRFLPKETGLEKVPLLRLFNLDNLNVQGDPFPDGVFDYVVNLTIYPRNGRVMFPVLEPFGSSLSKALKNSPDLVDRYTYPMLYDSTVTRAREYPDRNRFAIRGSYKTSASNEISLNAFNVPRGSIRVTAGGQLLQEGKDYEVDYGLGKVRVLNDAYITSGVPISVSFEDNSLFGFQQKNLIGIRADYEVSKNLLVGGTYMHLFERPFTPKVNIGDDPINNRVFGLDFTWGKDAPWLTKWVDAIPFISTKAPSNFNITTEFAAVQPGHSRAINEVSDKERGGVVYVDDFEGSAGVGTTLMFPVVKWVLASLPQNDEKNSNPLFPEARSTGTLSGVNRAMLNWYQIEERARRGANAESPYTDAVVTQEIFPNSERQSFQNLIRPLDLTYYPSERGAYNFDVPQGTAFSAGVDFDGRLKNPKSRWAGIMREIQTNDFEAANYEFIEFWLMSPFLNQTWEEVLQPLDPFIAQQREGTIYINLGNVSEDLMRDSRLSYENGLPGPAGSASETRRKDPSPWGFVPAAQVPLTTAFDQDENSRSSQDVGFDGMNDDEERQKLQDYLSKFTPGLVSQTVISNIQTDPANDNFEFFLSPVYTDDTPVRERYRRFNMPQGNSKPNQGGQDIQSSQLTPDTEDLNNNGTVDESEAYFQYKIPIEWDNNRGIKFNPFITDSVVADNGRIWYRFKIPLDQIDKKVGGIQDFRSIRFIRLYLKDFDGTEPITFRFADMNLGRNLWRRYLRPLVERGPGLPDQFPATIFDVNDVNVEENSRRRPFGYVLPEGIRREQTVGGFQPNVLQNEQSLSLRVENLSDGEAKAVYKLTNLDLRVFKKLKMFLHAESKEPNLQDGELSAFMRVGSDFEKNYYEYEVPLVFSRDSSLFDLIELSREVWRKENEFDFPLEVFTDLKIKRNNDNTAAFNLPYEDEHYLVRDGDTIGFPRRITIVGNPDLGLVKGAMIGIRNRVDNFVPHSAEIWVNELRVNGLDERGGVAAVSRMDFTLADLGQLTMAGNYAGVGYGAIDQNLAQRSQIEKIQYDVSTNLQLGKFFPEETGIKIPFLAQYSNSIQIPRFEPITRDLELKEVLEQAPTREVRDSIREQAFTTTEIKSINFNNVRKERKNTERKPMPWDVENFAVSYSFTETARKTPLIASDNLRNYFGALDYQYQLKGLSIQPLKKVIKKDKYLKFLSEFNFNPLPNSFSFGTVMDRDLQVTRYRFAGDDPQFNTFYLKKFTWDRNYNLTWDFTKSLKFTFNAVNQSIIDELPNFDTEGNPRSKQELSDHIWSNIRDFGRPKNYNHNLSVNYTLPTKLIPFLDFVNVRAQYNATYNWSAAALNATDLGNVIQNSQKRDISGDINFETLYNKSKYLKRINTPAPSGSKDSRPKKDAQVPTDLPGKKTKDSQVPSGQKDKKPTDKPQSNDKSQSDAPGDIPGAPATGAPAAGGEPEKEKKKKSDQPNGIERSLIRPLLMVRSVRLRYNEDYASTVPGFTPVSRTLGMAKGFDAPGLGYVIGLQPDDTWFDRAADRTNSFNQPWISTDFFLNQKVLLNYTQTIDGRVSLEPFAEFRIDVEMRKRYTENHSELFKDNINDGVNRLERLLPQDVGSMEVTYFSMNTLFKKDQYGIDLFNQFQDNRAIVSQRVGTVGTTHPKDGVDYTEGYGKTHPEVLIPAFLAAYTKKDAGTIPLDIFKSIPLPNWTLTYNGLSKLAAFKEMFSSINIRHGYKSSLVVNSFNTNLNYQPGDPFGQTNINPETQSFYSRLEIPNVVIREGFQPLLQLDIKTKNDISVAVSMDKTRELRMDFFSYQLAENKGSNYRVSFGYVMKNVKFGFLQGKKKSGAKPGEDEKKDPLQNLGIFGNRSGGGRGGSSQPQDLNLNFDFSLQDQVTINHLLDQQIQEPTRGQRAIRISPSAAYQFNRRLNFRLFVDYSRNIPYTTSAPPSTQMNGGLTVSFQLN